ncbi:MAG: cytochrome c3 family protein [Planctomycetes bacterium]|nr:cytochrome c3 family protein [Planctomycetota bacterium]
MNALWKALVALTSAALVVLFVWHDMQQNTPRDLSAVHAQVAELQGDRTCDLCHGADSQSIEQACLDCHKELALQLKLGQGLHAQLDSEQRADCGFCHLEHVGSDFQIAAERSFKLSGFPGPEGFEHKHAGFDLHGKHAPLQCRDCHLNADANPLPAGQRRYMGLVQACEGCHDDAHKGQMQRDCQACHSQELKFDDMSEFGHHSKFPLKASHSGLKCADCHEQESAHAVTALSGEVDFSVWRSCQECHPSPHMDRFVAQANCEDCHSEKHDSFVSQKIELSLAQHATSGFRLQAPHQDLACEKCHSLANGTAFKQRYPGRTAERCIECHQDPHNGQFDHAPYLEKGCLSCHADDRFKPHGFDLAKHQQTDFELTHSHLEADCYQCHAAGHFTGTSHLCNECHQDAHRGHFDAILGAGTNHPHGQCAECHQSTQFADLTTPFDHQRWTSYDLQGAHKPLECESCHARQAAADDVGRRFGWASDRHGGAPQECAGCHADIHLGLFDLATTPAEYRGERGCARCHQQHSFSTSSGNSFDHQLWTAFPLQGAHKQADCESCHGNGDQLDPPRRLGTLHDRYDGAAQQCLNCHRDPHDAMFIMRSAQASVGGATGRTGSTGCAQCHNALSFRNIEPQFDHAKWTGFALDGEHQRLACVACHAHLRSADSVGRTTARAKGTECNQCHVDVHVGQFAERGKTLCQQCHNVAQPDFLIPEFNHQTQTQFPLDSTHRALQCNECHQQWKLQDGSSAVRYRGIPSNCQDCHQVVPEQGGKR